MHTLAEKVQCRISWRLDGEPTLATERRRFTAEFKARVAIEALRGDRTIQEIAAKQQLHPSRVSGWKRQAQDGLKEVFARGTNHRQADH